MSMTLVGARRLFSLSVMFCLGLAVGSALYARQCLNAWAATAESSVAVICLLRDNAGVNPARILDDLNMDPMIQNARLIEPREVASWVSALVRESGTTGSLAPAVPKPAAIELNYRGAIREPGRFAAALRSIRENPAIGRVFHDSEGLGAATAFFSSARQILRAWLFLGVIACIAAATGVVARPARQIPAYDEHKQALGVLLTVVWAVGPVAGAWLCLFCTLAFWPMPPPGGLRGGEHLLVLGLTILIVEAAYGLTAAVESSSLHH